MSTRPSPAKKVGHDARGAVTLAVDAHVCGLNRPHMRAMGSTGAERCDFIVHRMDPPLMASLMQRLSWRVLGDEKACFKAVL